MSKSRTIEQKFWNQFDPVGKVWWVSPAFFAYMQEQCRLDPRWQERQLNVTGEVLVQVVHDHEGRPTNV